MVKGDVYMMLDGDLAGSMAKNRFRVEMLWGIRRIFEIYNTEEEFYVVFDYKCDIEVHTNNICEFYQIKTEKDGKIYTLNDIIKPNKAGRSILGKLYLLKKQCEENHQNVNIAIVSNRPLKVSDTVIYNKVENKEFTKFIDAAKETINKKLEKEIDITEINLNNTQYIYTNINLLEPENDIISGLVKIFEEIKKVEYVRITNLYRLLYSCVSEKASYENECKTYQEVLDKKSLSKKQFDEMLEKHISVSHDIVNQIASEYRKCSNMSERLERLMGLSNVIKDLNENNIEIRNIEKEIMTFIKNNLKILDKDENVIIKEIVSKFSSSFNIIYSEYYKEALVKLILNKYVEGIYEKTCN